MGRAVLDGILLAGATHEITVANRSVKALEGLPSNSHVKTATDIATSAAGADVIVIAVKPYAVDAIAALIRGNVKAGAVIVSVAAGITVNKLQELFAGHPVYRVIPNTAIAVGAGITFATPDSGVGMAQVSGLFKATGSLYFVNEEAMGAVTALCSCGIAYALKFLEAGMQAGVTLGLKPGQALEYFGRTMEGAAALVRANGTMPQQEVYKVTSPGGLTIKGVNALDTGGMTAAVVDAITIAIK